jgi:hypothetical protein
MSDALKDSAGYDLTPAEFSFFLDSPSIALAVPADEQREDMGDLNARGYIDVQFVDTTGRGLDIDTINDDDDEFSFLVKNESGEWVAPQGVGIDGAGQLVGDPNDLVFRYYFSGSFVPGIVRVQFAEGSFADLDGAVNAASEQQFAVVANAPAFEFRIDGSVLWRTGFSQGLYGNLGDPSMMKDLVKMIEQVTGPLGNEAQSAVEVLRSILDGINTAFDWLQPFLSEPMLKVNGFLRLGSQSLLGATGCQQSAAGDGCQNNFGCFRIDVGLPAGTGWRSSRSLRD